MATKTIHESDLSGVPGAEPFPLEVGSHGALEVDLTHDEREELEFLLRPYLSAARPAGRNPRRRQVPEMTPEERERIRAWADKQGFEVASYGRVPRHVQLAYDQAHGIRRAR